MNYVGNQAVVARNPFHAMRLVLALVLSAWSDGLLAWSYVKDTDRMGRGEIKRAYVQSSNTINLDFPYAGAQRATLTLRSHPQWGRDVYVDLERAQILCRRDDCEVLVRFDDAKPVRFGGTEPADHSSNTVFIQGYDRFVAAMQRAKRVRIELHFYRQGNRVLDFNIAGFDSSDLAPRKPKPPPKPEPTSIEARQEKVLKCNEEATKRSLRDDERRSFLLECLR